MRKPLHVNTTLFGNPAPNKCFAGMGRVRRDRHSRNPAPLCVGSITGSQSSRFSLPRLSCWLSPATRYPGKQGHLLGPVCQHLILEHLEKFSDDNITCNCTAIRILCEEILSPTIEDTDWTYRTLTFNTRPVTPSAVEQVRDRALKLLAKIYMLSESPEEKKASILSMQSATHTPHQGDYPDDLLNLTTATAKAHPRVRKEALPPPLMARMAGSGVTALAHR